VARLLGALRDRDRWLLIYDNAEDPAALAPYLPGGGGQVLITSRNPAWHELAIPVTVDVFTRTESVELLLRRVPELTPQDAGRIAEALGDLPLALSQAGAHLAETGTTAQHYLQLVNDRASQILARGASTIYRASLTASWHLAFDQLAADYPAALELLILVAHLAPEPIPFILFTNHLDRLPPQLAAVAGDPLTFTDLTTVLRRRALARVETDSLHLHRLVATLLRERSSTKLDAPAYAAVTLRLLKGAVPPDPAHDLATWPVWRQLLPHVLAITDEARHATPADTRVAWLLDRAAAYLQNRGDPRPALPLATRAHDLYRKWEGDDHPDTLRSANNLAIRLGALGEHEQARALDEDTLNRRRRILGDDHPRTLESANNLAIRLGAVGEYERARALAEDTLNRRRRILGDDHSRTLLSANDLARSLSAVGEHERARALHEDTLNRRRRILGDNHPRTLLVASDLARSLSAVGEHERARALAEDTFNRRGRILGDDHPDTLASANDLAICLSELGEHERARRLEEWVQSQRGT
jgi:tetratricopeptide (TPR) repeat protein